MTDLQSTNRTRLSRVRENSYGVIPTTPAFTRVRQTSSGLNANPQTIQSDEIEPDRQVTDLILVGLSAQGPIGGELSFYAHDDDLEEAMQGTWDVQPYIINLVADTQISNVSTTTLTVATGGTFEGDDFVTGHLIKTSNFDTEANNRLTRVSSSTSTTIVCPAASFTAESAPPVDAEVRVVGFAGATADLVATVTLGNALTSTLLDFTTLGLVAGMWVRIGSSVTDTSFATAANNSWCRIAFGGISANRLDFDIVPSGWSADAGTGKAIRVFTGDFLKNASTKRSVTFERQYLDHSPTTYEYFKGQMLNVFNMAMEAKAIVKLTKNYIGSDAQLGAAEDNSTPTTRVSGATDVEAPTYDVFNTTAHFGLIMVGGSVVSGPNFIMRSSFNINNNLRQQPAMGVLGSVGVGNGEFGVTGDLTTYFGSAAVYAQVLSNGVSSFSTLVADDDGDQAGYMFDVPRIKFSAGAPSVEGKNADVMINGTYQGIKHPDLGYTMSVTRFWTLPD